MSATPPESYDQHDSSGITPEALSCLVLIIFVVWGIGWLPWFLFSDPQSAGVFGDSFGAVNSLFTGIAVLFGATAFWLQHQEIRETAVSQAEQHAIQKQQTKILAETAKLQKQMRDDSRRRLQLEMLTSVRKELLAFADEASDYVPRKHNTVEKPDESAKANMLKAKRSLFALGVSLQMVFGKRAVPFCESLYDFLNKILRASRWKKGDGFDVTAFQQGMAQDMNKIQQHISDLWDGALRETESAGSTDESTFHGPLQLENVIIIN